MKKIIATFLVLSIISSCSKESKNLAKSSDSLSTKSTSDAATHESKKVELFNASVAEISPERTSELLKNKQNDTLYVTNFFATWCGPCMKEIPHFKEKMEELKGKPVKFTFVSLDDKTDWNETVKNFAEENELSKNVLLLDGTTLTPEFFKANFKTWDGNAIPFTIIKKGEKVEEIQGSMSKEELNEKLNSFN